MAKIDILLPYWGDFSLLKKSVESVFDQTEEDWHLYVFDDHYPTVDAQDYFKTIKDPRVTYYRHDKNLGITKNFNYAINTATATYCTLLGCDDIMLPTYVQRALAHIDTADFYQPGVRVIDANDTIYLPIADRTKAILRLKKPGIYSGERLATSITHGNWLYFPSIMWRTEAIKKFGFDEHYKITEDLVLEFNLLLSGASLSLDNEVTFHYRRFSDSLSSKEKKKDGIRFSEEAAVYATYAKLFKEHGWDKASLAARLRITSRIHAFLG